MNWRNLALAQLGVGAGRRNRIGHRIGGASVQGFILLPKRYFSCALLACALPCALASAGALAGAARADDLNPDRPPRAATASEIKQGDEAAADFEKSKSVKLLDAKASPAAKITLDKVNAMAKKLGAVSARPDVPYSVKVVEDKDVNAFTLPGGRIYLYRGLLDMAASDDEIAGVLAHEIGHNTRLHALRGAKLNRKFGWVNLLAIAGMMAGGTRNNGREASNGANLAQFSQYLLVGIMNGYGVGFEKEADSAAIPMMEKAGYNPSAMVTFMERLELQQKLSPQVNLGIFQTHPPSDERAQAARAAMESEGINFAPREVAGAPQAVATQKEGQWNVALGKVKLLELADAPDAQARAEVAAARTNALLRAGLGAWEMSVKNGELVARGQVLARASSADAQLFEQSADQIAQGWLVNYQRLFWREQLKGKF